MENSAEVVLVVKNPEAFKKTKAEKEELKLAKAEYKRSLNKNINGSKA